MTAPSCDREHGLELDRISVAHDGRSLIRDLSFSVERGSTTALLGPSGVGKSSLLRVIAGIDRPTGGRILLDGSDVPLFHLVGGADPDTIEVGARVRAVWADAPVASLEAIQHFTPVSP